jgi:hypothetical protein
MSNPADVTAHFFAGENPHWNLASPFALIQAVTAVEKLCRSARHYRAQFHWVKRDWRHAANLESTREKIETSPHLNRASD